MAAINPTKLTDWLRRRKPVLKWFQECRRGELRRRGSEGRFWRRSSGREFNFKLQHMLTVTSLWSKQWGLYPQVSRKKNEIRKKGSAGLMKSLLLKTCCASGTSLCGFSSQSQGTIWVLSMSVSWPTGPPHSPADVPYTPSGSSAETDTFCHWHIRTLCPLPASHFHSLSHDLLSDSCLWLNWSNEWRMLILSFSACFQVMLVIII